MARTVGATPYAARRRSWRPVIVLALLVVPLLEIAAIIAVGRVIGGWPTLALLLFESMLGAYLVRREGARTWRALSGALNSGAMPSRQLADAALVLIGGTLLLAPGFLTDIVGFFFILPFTRPLTRTWLERLVKARLVGAAMPPMPSAGGPRPSGPQDRPAGAGRDTVTGTVING